MADKTCTVCKQCKTTNDFYTSGAYFRSECKKCTTTRNTAYQKRNQTWKKRYGDDETRKAAMRKYYQENKDKFREYRMNHKQKPKGIYVPPRLRNQNPNLDMR